MKQIGIVICNYNKKNDALACIRSILESKFQDYDIYVVDNASTDGSAEAIRNAYGEQVTLLVNQENLGGSGGFNTGLRAAFQKGYPYLMCVDNDALLDENAVGNLLAFLQEHPETGIAAAKIYHREAPDYVQQFGQKIDFENFCTDVTYFNAYEDGSMPEYVYTDAVAACALMIRRSVIEKIGFMPEENFLYWDDTEWCYLCNRAGWKVASVGNAMALHAMGAKKELENTFPTYYAWRNWIRFFMRYTEPGDWEAMACTFLDSMFQIVYEGLHKGEKNRSRTVMLAYDDAIHGVTGKAGENRIFTLDTADGPWDKLFSAAPAYVLHTDKYPGTAQDIRDRAERMGYDIRWYDVSEAPENTPEIILCDNIFQIEDLSLQKIYIDINDCILASEEDVLDVINYNYSRRTFIEAQKPIFLQKLREQRQEMLS
ncbi:glycosyltransferase family 2 protein [Jutongia huaianensis]|uniref:Glycosyltransferase family 2 protein n=1 Tax=Jutongia huaianensis TaxID=2763668 RepID=A0ABR7MXY2_9FIRM|nr:glycosyltransferase family 2 protein [Jutongia huaianensis]MBC8561237.1 glycosyltransferase family 2 protein [Jutongia huaianensis]